MAADGTVSWFHTNHQGSVIAMSDGAGAAIAVANYSEYGKFGTDASGNPLTAPAGGSPFGYTGRHWDAKAGLYNYRARYYDPALGVFLSMDPIGSQDDPNLFMYVGLDPVNKTDPDGRQVVTAREREMAANRDLDGFWQSRTERGDPMGPLGEQFGGQDQSAGVLVADAKLEAALFAKHDDSAVGRGFPAVMATEAEMSISGEARDAMRSERAEIRVDLMDAHIGAVDSDTSGQPNFLSAGQITDYHHEVFRDHGLPTSTFGGTPFTGTSLDLPVTRGIWCASCDRR